MVDEEGDGLTVRLTREATLEKGVDEVEAARRCGGEDDPSPWEWEVEPGDGSVPVSALCDDSSFEVNVVAYGPADQPVDHLVVVLETVTPTP